ncbi:MAG: hypothetical protein ACJAQ6_001963 [Arenicella sp.]
MISLTLKQARKLVIVSQGIHRDGQFGHGRAGLVSAIEQLSYIQIDTISVVERAHHHTCWNRVKGYSPCLLDAAVASRDVFEYWSHAAAYMPMRDYRYSLPKKQAYLEGEQHGYPTDEKQMTLVMERIAGEGALQAKDFDQRRNNSDHAWGGHKPAKIALEQLFMQGELMVSKRRGFQKVFDLTERVLPDNINRLMPSTVEHYDHLILSFLRAHGIGTSAEISYLRKGLKVPINLRCRELVEDQQLIELEVAGKVYFALSSFQSVLDQRCSLSKIKILSPFDNLLIQRQRMRDLFNFDYQIECYVTAKKRKHGYFVLPILRGQEFVGRMDAKIDRKTQLMTVSKLFFETDNYLDLRQDLAQTMQQFLSFNQGRELKIEQVIVNQKAYSASALNLGIG